MKILTNLRREVGHEGSIPAGWKMAWYEPRRRVGVYYPAPLNWILRALRELIYRLRLALRAPVLECAQTFEMQRRHRERERLADEYARGYMAGWGECFDTCMETVEDQLSLTEDVWALGRMLTEPPKLSGPEN